jgi:broad specificity phosphatase PhoE
MERRMAEALLGLSALQAGAPLAALSHEIPIRLVVWRAAEFPSLQTMWDLTLPTGSVTELKVHGSVLRMAADEAAPLRE